MYFIVILLLKPSKIKQTFDYLITFRWLGEKPSLEYDVICFKDFNEYTADLNIGALP